MGHDGSKSRPNILAFSSLRWSPWCRRRMQRRQIWSVEPSD